MITTLKQKSIREKEINEHHINEIFKKARATLKLTMSKMLLDKQFEKIDN
jgi:hypothetical protein